jgi:sigma-B regulation protein RsbU (phosphoserine phosphatase)
MCYAVLDMSDWTLTVANAGHLSPLLCHKDSEAIYLDSQGHFPLGLKPDLRYINQSHLLQPGEALVLYTDGVTEVHDSQRRLLGFEALQAMVARQPVDQLVDVILAGVTRFAGAVAQEDDLTLVVVQRTG